jgi:hypothetical protein
MKLRTTRTQIREVAAAWRRQYGGWDPQSDKAAIGRKLDALDTETATAEDVLAIIGNNSWTRLTCDECEKDVSAVIQVGDADRDYRVMDLCAECLRAAAALVDSGAPSSRSEER